MYTNTRGQIAESDWKLWRALSEKALERHCQKILTEAAGLEKGGDSAHARYLKLYRLLKRRDQEIADVFNDPRRSRAFLQIARAVRNRIITRAELATFSEDTQAVVRTLLGEYDWREAYL
jgi:hypothetical protein